MNNNKRINEAAPKIAPHTMDVMDASTASKTVERATRDRDRTLEISSLVRSADEAANIAEQRGDVDRAAALRKAAKDLRIALQTKGRSNSKNSADNANKQSDESGESKDGDDESTNETDNGQNDGKDGKTGDKGTGDTSDGKEDSSNKEDNGNANKNRKDSDNGKKDGDVLNKDGTGEDESGEDTSKNKNRSNGGKGTDHKNQSDQTDIGSGGGTPTDSGDQGDSEEANNHGSNGTPTGQGKKGKGDLGGDTGDGTESQESQDGAQENSNGQNNSKSSSNSGKGGQSGSKGRRNPFEIDPENSTMSRGGSPVDNTSLEDIIKILRELTGDARKGALDALKDILQKKQVDISQLDQSLFESISVPLPNGNPLEWDDDLYNTYMNALVDEISDITGSQIETEQERENRINKIDAQRNSKVFTNRLAQEDEKNRLKDPIYQAEMQRRQRLEKEKYKNVKSFKSIGHFLDDLINAIEDQVDEYLVAYDDPSQLNRRHQNDGVVLPGTSTRWELQEDKPSISVYFDRSGTWKGDTEALRLGESVIATLLKYERQDLLTVNIWYFSNELTRNKDDSCLGGGTGAFPEIIDQINQDRPKNVILMTDSDFDHYDPPTKSAQVEGCLWFIWRRGEQSQTALRLLSSESGQEFQYSLS